MRPARPGTRPMRAAIPRCTIWRTSATASCSSAPSSFSTAPTSRCPFRTRCAGCRAQSLYCAAWRGRVHCALSEANGVIKRLRPATRGIPSRRGKHRGTPMDVSMDLLLNALAAGVLLGGFYAAVTIGVSISFGILDIVNIAHPAFIILGSYIAYILNTRLGIDPIVASVIMLPAFYALGGLVYQIYHAAFERYGQESLRGLAFFFGLLFITEVVLILAFGVDYRYVTAPYIGPSLHWGVVDLPLRMLVPCLVSLAVFIALQVFLSGTFTGRAIMAAAQDPLALRLMGCSPTR